MSDYGCVIVIDTKNNGLSEAEGQEILSQLKQLVDSEAYNPLIDLSEARVMPWDDNHAIILTEYYHGGGDDDEELREFAEEEDNIDAEDIVEKLQNHFGDKYAFSFEFHDW